MALSDARARQTIDWRSAILSGIIAGAVFMMLEMLLVPVFVGGSPWGPPRMIAAIGMGRGVLPPPDTFALVPMLVAMVIHFMLSMVLAVILALIVSRVGLGLGMAVLVGAAFGLVIYLINFYALTAFFPWFAMARNWISIFAHVMFGAVAALSYMWLQKPRGQTAKV
jgi:uncharacterized membrane protein YagU involved in acid resistance